MYFQEENSFGNVVIAGIYKHNDIIIPKKFIYLETSTSYHRLIFKRPQANIMLQTIDFTLQDVRPRLPVVTT